MPDREVTDRAAAVLPGELPEGPANVAREVPLAPRAPAPRGPDALDGFFYREDEAGPDLGVEDQLTVAATVAAEEERQEYLSFRLADEEYAVPLRLVREIQKPPPITEVPRAPPHVLGVITLRGEVIPVFDPKKRLGLPPQAATRLQRVMIVDVGEGSCGAVVDRVGHVVRLAPSQIEVNPPGFGGPEGELLAGVGRVKGRMLILLDLAAVLRKPGERA